VKLIVVVGGVTRAELAALRLVNRRLFPRLRFLVATSALVNQRHLLHAAGLPT